MTTMYAQDDTHLWAREQEEYFCDGCGQRFLDFDYPSQPHPWYCAACERELEEEYHARERSYEFYREDCV